MHIHQNIKMLRQRKGRTQTEAAKSMGLTRSQIAGYETHIKPTIDALLKMSAYFDVSLDLMVKENLSAYSERQWRDMEQTTRAYAAGTHLRILATTVDADDREQIEVVPIKAKAGYLSGYASPEFVGGLPRMSLPFVSRHRKHRVFQVEGDSMLPIPEHAWLVCTYIDDWHDVKDGERYVILTENEGVVFKLAYNRIKSDHALLLCSTNPLYPPFSVSVTDIREIWKLVMVMESN